MMMPPCLLSTAHLGPVAYYAVLYHAERVVIEAHEHYNKQSWRNRFSIGTDQGPQTLSIPVAGGAHVKQPIGSIRLSAHGDWRHQMESALATNYGSTPFYEYYIDDLLAVYDAHRETLFDLNEALRRRICALIGFAPRVDYTPAYAPADGYVDLRERLHPKRPLAEALPAFRAVPYWQVHAAAQPFMANLSIVDLLFNMGPESLLVLRDAMRPEGADAARRDEPTSPTPIPERKT